MDMLQGLIAPKVPDKIEDEATKTFFRVISRFLDEVLLKVKKFAGDTETITVITDVQTDGGQLQKKTRSLTIKDGIIYTVGAESDWANAEAV